MSSSNTVQFHKIYYNLDRGDDGLVSVDELLWLLDTFGVHNKRDELELLVGGKGLNYVDFLFFYETLIERDVFEHEMKESERKDEALESDLRKAFRVFDLDDDGFISCEDLRAPLSRLGLWDEKCGKDCMNMINVYDINSDGLLDFEEFKNMMRVKGH